MSAVGERIKAARKSLGMTQQEFVNPLETTQGALSAIETGKEAPSRSLMLLICKEYHIHKEWLIYGEGTEMFEQDVAVEQGTALMSVLERGIGIGEDKRQDGSVFNRMDFTEERNPYIADLYSILANETAVGQVSEEQEELQNRQRPLYDLIKERLHGDADKLLFHYDNIEGEIHNVIAKESFISGFRTAFHLIAEAKR